MEFLEVPLFDDDIAKMLVRFTVNLFVLTLIVRFVYYRNTGDKEYLFSFFMINILVFFICFTLKKYELDLGMALGLFAIFAILRYRTDAIPNKEMTYLFMVIGVAVINSLSNTQMSYLELAVANVAIVGFAGYLEHRLRPKREFRRTIRYEKLDLIRPDKHHELIADLEERMGLKISRVEMGQVDFLSNTVKVSVYYDPEEQATSPHDDVDVTWK